jgi:hypothetical protein
MAVSSTTGGLRTGVCLSTDRPQNPYNGQVIYETDTNRTLVWDNSAWVVIANASATNFPTSLDTNTVDSIAALQAKVGVDGSAVTDSLDYKVENFTNKLGSGSGNTYPWSNGEELHATDLNAAVGNTPRVAVYNSIDQSCTGTSYNTITFNSEAFDSHGMHSTVSNTSRLTIPSGWGGHWLVIASGVITTGYLSITFLVNGVSRIVYAGAIGTVGSGYSEIGGASAILELDAGQYIEWSGYATGNLTLYGTASLGGISPYFAAKWLGE